MDRNHFGVCARTTECRYEYNRRYSLRHPRQYVKTTVVQWSPDNLLAKVFTLTGMTPRDAAAFVEDMPQADRLAALIGVYRAVFATKAEAMEWMV